jgi:hypothetical protein
MEMYCIDLAGPLGTPEKDLSNIVRCVIHQRNLPEGAARTVAGVVILNIFGNDRRAEPMKLAADHQIELSYSWVTWVRKPRDSSIHHPGL